MKKYIIAISLGSLAVASVAYADFAPSAWKYMKPITITATDGASEYVKLNLDKEVSFNAKSDLSDLRVVGSNLGEVPYQLVVDSAKSQEQSVGTTMHDLSVSQGDVMFMVDVQAAGSIHNNLTISTYSKNFKHKVSVYSADKPLALSDGGWRLLTNAGYIYNFHDQITGFDAGSGEVSYPENTSRYLRVVIQSGEGAQVIVSSARVFRLHIDQASQSALDLGLHVVENAQMKSTELVADLGGNGLPTHQITLSTKEVLNFNRRAAVQGSNDGKNWQALAQEELFMLTTPLFTGSHLSLDYPETNLRYLRVVIFNYDDKPVVWADSAVVLGINRSVIFATNVGNEYALYYGNEKAFTPHYDLARFFQYVESVELTPATLTPENNNPKYLPPPPPTVPYSEKKPYLLNIVLVILVVALTLFIVFYLKKLKLGERGRKP